MKRFLIAVAVLFVALSSLPDKRFDARLPEMIRKALAASCTSPCVQRKGNNNASTGNTVAVTLDNSVAAGNLLVADVFFCSSIGCSVDTNNETMAVTDDHSHTLTPGIESRPTPITGSGGEDVYLGMHYQPNASSGSTTVTATATVLGGGAATYYLIIAVTEYTNVATASPLDVTVSNNNTGTDATGTTASACATGTCIVHGAVFLDSGTQPSPGMGYTESLWTSNVDNEYKTVSSPGAVTINWVSASTKWVMNGAIFKPSGGGGGSSSATSKQNKLKKLDP